MTLAHFGSWWTSTPTTELVWITIGVHRPIHILDALHRAMGRDRGLASFRRRSVISARPAASCSWPTQLPQDPVFIVGQAAGLVIYARNIYFIWLSKRAPSPANVT
jgi:hypothetical protein